MENLIIAKIGTIEKNRPQFAEHTIQDTREWRGLTRKQVADLVGISTRTLKSYEEYKTSPGVYVSYLIAAALGVTVEDINWIGPTKA